MSETIAVTGATPRRGGSRWRVVRAWLPWILILGALCAIAAIQYEEPTVAALDPNNAEPDGARAVVQVLGDQGVQVVPVRNRAELLGQDPAGDATLVLTRGFGTDATQDGTPEVLERYRHVVLVDPDDITLGVVGLGLDPAESKYGDEEAEGCDDPVVGQVKRVAPPEGLFRDVGSGLQACFRTKDGSALMVSDEAAEGRRIDALASEAVFANTSILEADHALLALRLLSRDPVLVWYTPDGSDLLGSVDAAPTGTPEWYDTMRLLLAAVLVAAALWQGRRLGPLVVERMPVVIKASETVRSHGRLHHAAGDGRHSLLVLQEGTRQRIAKRLNVAAGATTDQLNLAVATATGRRVAEINDLLNNATDISGDALVARARALAALEEEIR